MSNMSYTTKENSNDMKDIQGGEKKVMKKILSVALSTAMAFSMFASVAFGDDTAPTTQQQYDSLVQKGVFNGLPDGSAHLEDNMTRGQFAKVLTKLLGLKEVTGTFSYNDKNYGPKNWAAPYIEAVTAAGLMQGKDTVKKIFDFNGNVTVQEVAKVLAIALKLEVPATADNNAADWAKGYVQAAVDAKLIPADANFKGNATRSLLVAASFQVDQITSAPTVASYKVVDAKNVELTLSNKEVVTVALTTALEANKETEIKYTYNGKEYTTKVTYVVTTATKVESVTASNLKEVVVKFDGTVDKDTAEDEANYTLKSGKVISSAVLSDDEKTVTLTLSNTLTNNKVDYLSVSGVKAGTATISASQVEFLTSDNVLPEVSSVKSLGTKAVKVVFSEPVTGLTQSNFELDGKAFYGKLSVRSSDYTRSVILTPYNTTALAVGAHKLVVKGVNDAAGFVSLTSTHDVTVVEDKDAPTVAEATATLEAVTIKFSEDVDADTATSANIYWKSGTTKKTGTVTKLADDKYKVTFTGDNQLPSGAVTIYVDNVADYSGNKVAAGTTVVVNPTVDQTRPEVKKVTALSAKQIQVKFSKDIDTTSAAVRGNYTVLNKDGDVISVLSASASGDVVTINLYSSLSAGDNTLTIKNLQDATRLKNTMLDYTGKVSLADTAAPEIDSKLVNLTDRSVIVGFNEKMDYTTLSDYSNYHVVINDVTVPLTSDLADITVLQDSNAVAIKFVESIGNNQPVRFLAGDGGTVAKNVSTLKVLGVKDAAGNLLKEFTQSSGNTVDLTTAQNATLGTYDTDYPSYNAALTGTKTIKVKFTAGIKDYSSLSAFTVTKGGTPVSINSIAVDGTSTVTLNLASSVGTSTTGLVVNTDLSKLQTLVGPASSTSGLTPVSVLDKVAAVAVDPADAPNYTVSTVNGHKAITVNFTEPVQLIANSNVSLLAKDFKVVRVSGPTELKAGVDFTIQPVAPGATSIVIVLNDDVARTVDTTYTVEFLGSKNLVDQSPAANPIAAAEPAETAVVTANAALAALITAAQQAVTNAQTALTAATTADTNAQAALATATTDDANAQAALTAATTADTNAQAALAAAQAADAAGSTAATQAALAVATTDAATAATALTTAQANATAAATALTTAQTNAAAAATAKTNAQTALTAAQAALAAL